MKADHSDEIRFVFGGAFLKGDIVMFGKKRLRGLLFAQGLELGMSWGKALLARSPSTAQYYARVQKTGGLVFNLWLTDIAIPWKMPSSYF